LAIVQYFFLARNTIGHRVTGFMGHWMTLSGELMLVLICLADYLVFASSKRRWLWFLLLSTLSFSLALTMTRSVWIATVTGLILLLFMRHFRLRILLIAAVSATLMGLLAPDSVEKRMKSVINSNDPSNYARTSIWRAGLRMVEAHPWLGVGPQRVYRVFYDYHPHPEDRYRSGFFPVHLHNNLLQFAAERGIPCALAWLWLMVKLASDHWAGFRHPDTTLEMQSIYAIGFLSVVVLFIAGMFEFNFGDSEVLMIFLFLVSAPYVGNRG
jgi:O-antigen ligase